jgi:ribosomal protein S18 acetylase RimI-like enzyme
MITTINEYKLFENINSIDYTINVEDWENSSKIVIKNEKSPNQKLVGVLDFVYEKEYIYIESISVMRFYKRMGFGKLMFDKLVEIAKNKGYKKIELNAHPMTDDVNMEILINMYQKWGFKIKSQTKEYTWMIYTI